MGQSKLTIWTAIICAAHGPILHAGQSCPQYAAAAPAGIVASNDLVEASGLAASRQNSGVFWSHNDSGGPAQVFALSLTGAHLGVYGLTGAASIDYEDIAVGHGPTPGVQYLFVGDIGDNANVRPNIQVYRVPEPAVNPNQAPVNVALSGVQTITLTYPDSPRDAETLMVDVNGDIYIATKRVTALSRVYRAGFPQSTTQPNTMEFVAELPWGSVNGIFGATGGDISHDGSAVIVRRYSGLNPAATLWHRPPGTDLADAFDAPGCNVLMPSEIQGEAVAFSPFDLSYFTVSEGSHPTIYHFNQITAVGDINGDGTVDIDDLFTLLGSWGPCPTPPAFCPADLDSSGTVNIDDLFSLIGNWS